MDRLQNALCIFRYVVRSPNCCARDSISCCPAHFFKKECLIFSLISFLRVASFATGSFNSFHRSPIVGNVVSVSTLLLICFWVSVRESKYKLPRRTNNTSPSFKSEPLPLTL